MMEMQPEVNLLIIRKLPRGFTWRCHSSHSSQPQHSAFLLLSKAFSAVAIIVYSSIKINKSTIKKSLEPSKLKRGDQWHNEKKLQTPKFAKHFKICKAFDFYFSATFGKALERIRLEIMGLNSRKFVKPKT